MNENLVIFGAGLAGLIAARMLIDRQPVVYEKQDELPHNHEAILRFRHPWVGERTNIPFRKVQVVKAVHGSVNPISDAVRYSKKVTGKVQARSILDTSMVERYVAPGDLVARLASTATIKLGMDFEQWTDNLYKPTKPPIISTIPVPVMMKLFRWREEPIFSYQSGWNQRLTIDPRLEPNLNCTLYYPGDEPCYRASVTGGEIIIEGVGNPPDAFACYEVASHLGLSKSDIVGVGAVRQSRYQKIVELSVSDRENVKRFVMWLTATHGIYSLGRFATWRPKLLLDDLVKDVQIIQTLIDGHGSYEYNLK